MRPLPTSRNHNWHIFSITIMSTLLNNNTVALLVIAFLVASLLGLLYILRRQRIANNLLIQRERDRANDLIMVSDISQQVNALQDSEAIFQQVVAFAHKSLGFHPVTILAYESETSELVGRASSIAGFDPYTVRVPHGQGLISAAYQLRETVLVDDVSQDDRFVNFLDNPMFDAAAAGTRAEIAIPLIVDAEPIGILDVQSAKVGRFSEREQTVLGALANEVSAAIDKAIKRRERRIQTQLEQELKVARQIQASLIPDGSPELPSATVASYWGAAQQVSGDFYDFIQLPTSNWAIVIADVAGKGVPAAIFMAMCRTIIRAVALSPNYRDPAATLTRANRIILNDTASDFFITALFSEWNPQTRQLTYVNGGHNPPLLLKPDGQTAEIGDYGIALGVIDDVPLAIQTIQLEPNDTVIFYTDGVTEAMDRAYKPFGLARFCKTVADLGDHTPAEIVSQIKTAINQHADGMAQSDDVTLVVLRVD